MFTGHKRFILDTPALGTYCRQTSITSQSFLLPTIRHNLSAIAAALPASQCLRSAEQPSPQRPPQHPPPPFSSAPPPHQASAS